MLVFISHVSGNMSLHKPRQRYTSGKDLAMQFRLFATGLIVTWKILTECAIIRQVHFFLIYEKVWVPKSMGHRCVSKFWLVEYMDSDNYHLRNGPVIPKRYFRTSGTAGDKLADAAERIAAVNYIIQIHPLTSRKSLASRAY